MNIKSVIVCSIFYFGVIYFYVYRYEFPFTLRAVSSGGQTCALCPWTKFCRGCALPCGAQLVKDVYQRQENAVGNPTLPTNYTIGNFSRMSSGLQ